MLPKIPQQKSMFKFFCLQETKSLSLNSQSSSVSEDSVHASTEDIPYVSHEGPLFLNKVSHFFGRNFWDCKASERERMTKCMFESIFYFLLKVLHKIWFLLSFRFQNVWNSCETFLIGCKIQRYKKPWSPFHVFVLFLVFCEECRVQLWWKWARSSFLGKVIVFYGAYNPWQVFFPAE